MDEACFACGPANKNGLHLRIVEGGEGVCATIDPPPWSNGYQNVVHGGLVATILDELAVWAAYKRGYRSVTAELTMRMKDPMKIGQTYVADARVTNVKHRLIAAESRILDRRRALVASATVKLLKIG